MNVRYLAEFKEWIADAECRRYRISRLDGHFVLEEIVQPCGEMRYIADFDTLGGALEAVMRDEMYGGDEDENV